MNLIDLFKVITWIYFQCATKLMVSKKVVKKKYENKLRNQSLAIDGIKKENFESLVLKKLYRKVSNCT